MKTLVPCAACGRHVRTSDSACPFCGHTVDRDAASRAVPRSGGARLGRAALFAFGATIAATAAACGPTPSNPDASGNDAQVQDTGVTQDAGTMALYGGPPADTGVDTDADDGSPGARYGAVPPPDAG